MKKEPLLLIINGFPATGKTTLAKEIAKHFDLPMVSVDELKEIMFDRIGNWEDEKIFDSVSRAAYDLMYHTVDLLLSSGQSCIIEAFLRKEMAQPRIAKLKKKYNPNILQILVHCDARKLIQRYNKRHNTGDRHSCHPLNISMEEHIKLNGKSQPVKIDGETIAIDTSDFKKVNRKSVFDKVERYLQKHK